EMRAGVAKYGFLGKKDNVPGPHWFGNSDETLRNIARNRSVGLVEGYYDLLACRLMMPGAPILSTGTKTVNESHIQYLRMLGVKDIHLMFDNEAPKGDKDVGAGELSARYIKNENDGKHGQRFHV